MRKISGILAASALVASIALVAPAANAAETITGSGSSYMNAFQQTCSAGFTDHRVTYTSTGSTTGKSQFAAGTTTYGGSDSLYGATEKKPAAFTYVPLVGGAIGIVYNVAGIKNLNLTPKVAGDIFQGKIKTWDNAAIKKLNPTAKLPKQNIQVVYRSDGSGTTNNFTHFMKQVVGGTWKQADGWADGLGQSPVGTSARTNQGVISTVKTLAYSITYADLADAKAAKLPFASVQNSLKEFVQPTVANAARFMAAQKLNATTGEVSFNYNSKVRGGYPITLVAYGLAPTASSNPDKAKAVKEYFTYIIKTCGPQRAAVGSYVAMSGKVQQAALALIAKIK